MSVPQPSVLLPNPGPDPAFSLVTVRNQRGLVFKGRGIESYCFVPWDCIRVAADMRLSIDEIRYFRSGWSIRNMRAVNGESGGILLFPEADRLVSDLAAPAARQFLRRISGHAA